MLHRNGRVYRLLLGAVAASAVAAGVQAAALETPTLTFVEPGKGRVEFLVTAGVNGTPGGFTVMWATEVDFLAEDEFWLPTSTTQGRVHFFGVPSLNDFPGEPGTFLLESGQAITIQLGDVADESGV